MKLLHISLRVFGEGEAAPGGSAEPATTQTKSAAPSAPAASVETAGAGAAAAPPAEAAQPPARPGFEELIQGEYKPEFDRYMEGVRKEALYRLGTSNQMRQLHGQARELQKQYPGFDLTAELRRSPRFEALLLGGVDVRTAYQACHPEECLAAAARRAEVQTLEKVRSNRSRPSENGAGGTQPVRLSSDPSKWTREQMREVERRVQRGERITL